MWGQGAGCLGVLALRGGGSTRRARQQRSVGGEARSGKVGQAAGGSSVKVLRHRSPVTPAHPPAPPRGPASTNIHSPPKKKQKERFSDPTWGVCYFLYNYETC